MPPPKMKSLKYVIAEACSMRHNENKMYMCNPVADPGGRCWHMPPTGPDSFILTYKFFEM